MFFFLIIHKLKLKNLLFPSLKPLGTLLHGHWLFRLVWVKNNICSSFKDGMIWLCSVLDLMLHWVPQKHAKEKPLIFWIFRNQAAGTSCLALGFCLYHVWYDENDDYTACKYFSNCFLYYAALKLILKELWFYLKVQIGFTVTWVKKLSDDVCSGHVRCIGLLGPFMSAGFKARTASDF